MADADFRVKNGINVANGAFVANTLTVVLPSGNTTSRPVTGANGMIRFNTDTNGFEGYANATWGAIGGGGGSPTVPTIAEFFTNPNTIPASIELTVGNNAVMVGPITVSTGMTLTVDTGARLVII